MKYTQSFKLDVIAYYKQGHSFKQTAKQFNLASDSTVRIWVKLFDKHGASGIATRKSKTVYSPDFKLSAITAVLEGQSIRQVATHLNISNPALLSQWLKAYQSYGIMGLQPKAKGRPSMTSKTNKSSKQGKAAKSTLSIKDILAKADPDKSRAELLRELEYLRAENDLLKKLEALDHQRQKLTSSKIK